MLFNETIKSNIKFGDLSASDARVLEVAIQANALAFIMQNDEDYSAPQVIEKVTEGFNNLTELLSLQNCPQIQSLLTLAKQDKIDFKHLMFVNMMLPFFTKDGFMFIEENFNDFIVTINAQSVKSDCTW